MFVDSLMRSYLALKQLRRCDFGAVPLRYDMATRKPLLFLRGNCVLFTAIALLISPLDWSRFHGGLCDFVVARGVPGP